MDNAERAAQQVGSTAQLFFYDWEASILNENCRTDENENDTHLINALEAVPGAIAGIAVIYFIGLRQERAEPPRS